MKNNRNRARRDWTNFFNTGKNSNSPMDAWDFKKTQRPAREKRALEPRKTIPTFRRTSILTEKRGDDIVHKANNGAQMIIGDGFVTVKLPYGISANDIWRATLTEEGKQRNSLSLSAKHYKQDVHSIYAPLLRALDWKAISRPCEIRLVVQPPAKTRSYSVASYPRFDIDNYPKLLIDALKGIDLLYKDDNLFVSEKIELAEPIEGGCVWLSCVFIEQTNWLKKPVDFEWLAGRVA